mmetsp:Transcript_42361/g.135638  ORF Transcript_42361/g.135638 Transcript_42361/m.135638 type:complete len:162 (+) Transcript_42361:490-975(+)
MDQTLEQVLGEFAPDLAPARVLGISAPPSLHIILQVGIGAWPYAPCFLQEGPGFSHTHPAHVQIHLAVNSYSLNNVGPAYENVAGHARLAAVYLGSGVAGNALSYMMSPNPAVGASGAVFGVAGALFAFLVLHRDVLGKGGDRRIENLARIFGINLIYGCR